MRPSQTWILGATWLAGLVGGAPPARACDGATEQIVGYSWPRDEYVTEERPLNGAPSRFVTRLLSTDEAVDYATCSGPGPCTAPDTLGTQACWLRSLPHSAPLELWLAQVDDDPAGAEVRLAQGAGSVPLVRVRRAGRLVLRSAVREESRVILILADTVDDKGCSHTHERAIAVPLNRSIEPTEVDFTAPTAVAIDLRQAPPLSPDRLEPLVMAARSAAAAHLDSLAACWAQQALSIIAANHARKNAADPSIQVEDVRIILVGPQPAGDQSSPQ